MAIISTPSSPLLPLFILFLITTPLPSHSFFITTYQTLFSLAHSLMTRVANLRASRGDIAGSERARGIAQKIDPDRIGLSFWRFLWSIGLDYSRNYDWRDNGMPSFELFGTMSDLKELMGAINELTRMDSEVERVKWVQRNYSNVLKVSKSLFGRLLKVFRQSGPLKEVIETVQREVFEGDLLRDCLELGSSDLKGLIQVLSNIAQQVSSTTGETEL